MNGKKLGYSPEIEEVEAICEAMFEERKRINPPQSQEHKPGIELEMVPQPISISPNYKPSDKLKDKVAIITGGDSGIGRAIAYHYVLEGAKVVIVYLNEDVDAIDTQKWINGHRGECLLISGDIGNPDFCKAVIQKTIEEYQTIDILVNHAGEQYERGIEEITPERLIKLFSTNVFSSFYLTKYALPYLRPGSAIINTTSVTAYRGSAHLLDYSATRGAVVSFTRSLAQQLIERNIRVNGVAPGPIWTPFVTSTFSAEQVSEFGSQTPMQRPGQPCEVAPCYVFLASEDSSYMTGQILHPNGGEIINA